MDRGENVGEMSAGPGNLVKHHAVVHVEMPHWMLANLVDWREFLVLYNALETTASSRTTVTINRTTIRSIVPLR